MIGLMLTLAAGQSMEVTPESIRAGMRLSILCVEEVTSDPKASGWMDLVPGENKPTIIFAASKGSIPFLENGLISSTTVENAEGVQKLHLVIAGKAAGADAVLNLTFGLPQPQPHQIKVSLETAGGQPRAFDCIPVPPLPPARTK